MILTNSTNNYSRSFNLTSTIHNFFCTFIFDTDDFFEENGILSLLFSPSFDFINITIQDLNNNIIEQFYSYRDYRLQYKMQKKDIKIKVDYYLDNNLDKTIEKIYYFNAYNALDTNFFYNKLYNDGNLIDEIILYQIINNRVKIYFQYNGHDFEPNSFYFYDLENPQRSHLPINYFKFSDFNQNEIILNSNNELIIGNDLMKYGTRFFMAYPVPDLTLNKYILKLANYNHYLLFWNIYNYINLINKKYNINFDEYKFYVENPLNKNDALIVWIL